MIKFQITSILILIGIITIASCEKVPQMLEPALPDTDTMEHGDMTNSEKMIEMMERSLVVINELMAGNNTTIADPQGDYDDWLELHNPTDTPVILTGMYLSDKEDNPTKWEFPENTEISANGYIIVWLDENGEDAPDGLHANFKLSKGGETVILVDTDANGNTVLDSITFGEQEDDVAFGRLPNGTGDFQVVVATPGSPNTTN